MASTEANHFLVWLAAVVAAAAGIFLDADLLARVARHDLDAVIEAAGVAFEAAGVAVGSNFKNKVNYLIA